MDSQKAKRRGVRLLQRYLLNPPVKLLAWGGLAPGHVLIETTGRRSGQRRRNVVGLHLEGDTGWIVAEQGWRRRSTPPGCRHDGIGKAAVKESAAGARSSPGSGRRGRGERRTTARTAWGTPL